MNNQIIPQGSSETITDGTITNKEVMLLMAETDLAITGLVYAKQTDPANAAAVDAFTLKAGRHLFNIKSVIFTGTATVIYRTN